VCDNYFAVSNIAKSIKGLLLDWSWKED